MENEKLAVITHSVTFDTIFTSKKTISPVVAMALLLVVAVVGTVGFQGWFNDYSSQLFTSTEQQSSSSVSSTGIDNFVSGELYFNNGGDSNVTITQIKIGSRSCYINQTISSGTSEIQLCGGDYTSGEYEIVVYTADKIYSKKFFSANNFNIFQCLENGTNGFHGGSGIGGNPYQICNCNQLQTMNQSLTSSYELVSNVDCSETSTWNFNGTTYHGFTPIGNFLGDFNGNSYIISEIYINRSEESGVGMFSNVLSTVSNVILENFNTIGYTEVGTLAGALTTSSAIAENITVRSSRVHSTYVNVGGLIGQLSSGANITNILVDKTNVISDNQAGGGIVGYTLLGGRIFSSRITNSNVSVVNYGNGGISGYLFLDSLIENSSSYNLRLVGTGNIGGIVGTLQGNADMKNIFSNRIFINASSGPVGGILGRLTGGKINNSYSKNLRMFSNTQAGGIVGLIASVSNISNSYSFSANISANNFIGGVVGEASVGNIFSSYWDNQTVLFTGTDITDSGLGSQQTTSALQTPTSNTGIYANWSTLIWDFGTASEYPSLQWE